MLLCYQGYIQVGVYVADKSFCIVRTRIFYFVGHMCDVITCIDNVIFHDDKFQLMDILNS